jgi:Domain of unknown function (DUF6285)
MQDRPTAAELLATLTEYLEGEVQPNVTGTLRYHTLVAANITRMLRREAELYPAAVQREVTALAELLELPATTPDGDDTRRELGTLNAELARRLRAGEGDHTFEQRCWDVVFEATKDKLAISKPGYDSYDMADEVRLSGTAGEVRLSGTAGEVRLSGTGGEVGTGGVRPASRRRV